MATSRCTRRILTNKLDYLSRRVLPFLMRQAAAKPFMRPVDYIAYNLPEYSTIIKHPMDLNTIKARIDGGYYSNCDECLIDFNYIFQNCFIFNEPDDKIILKGLALEKFFYSQLQSLPKEEYKLVKHVYHQPFAQKKFLVQSLKPKKKRKLMKKKSANSFSVSEDVKTFEYVAQNSDFDKCSIIMTELMSQKYRTTNHLFFKPIDSKSFDPNSCHDIIKYPSDLFTIKSNLDNGLYKTTKEFINDFYLMLNNCYICNGINSEIGSICRKFQTDFENLYFVTFNEKCHENVYDEAVHFLFKIMRRHKEIEEMIRFNTEKMSHSRQRIDMIVSILNNSEEETKHKSLKQKRKMMIKLPETHLSSTNVDKIGRKPKILKADSECDY